MKPTEEKTMKIFNISANREMPISQWWPTIYCKSWHEKLRFWLICLLYKSFTSSNVSYSRVDTGTEEITEWQG